MALTYTYHDAYLAPLIEENDAWEQRARADVTILGTFPAPWPEKLTVLRAYVLCCLESLADENDVFSAKLKQYQREFTASLQAAKIAANTATSRPTGTLAIPIERA